MTAIEGTGGFGAHRLSEKPADWLTRKQAAAYLARIGCQVSVRTLEKLASNNNAGKGPAFTRSRVKTIRYMRADLDTWGYLNTKRVI